MAVHQHSTRAPVDLTPLLAQRLREEREGIQERDDITPLLQRLTGPIEELQQAHRILDRVWRGVAESVVIAGRGDKAGVDLSEDLDLLLASAFRKASEVSKALRFELKAAALLARGDDE